MALPPLARDWLEKDLIELLPGDCTALMSNRCHTSLVKFANKDLLIVSFPAAECLTRKYPRQEVAKYRRGGSAFSVTNLRDYMPVASWLNNDPRESLWQRLVPRRVAIRFL